MGKVKFWLFIWAGSVLFALMACQFVQSFAPAAQTETAVSSAKTQTAAVPTNTATPTATSTPEPTATFTPTPTETSLPTETPTDTPSPSPVPTLDIAAILITAEDLPDGFVELPSEMIFGSIFDDQELPFIDFFTYMDLLNIQIVMGFVGQAEGSLEQFGYQTMFDNPDLLFDLMASQWGEDAVIEEAELETFKDVGNQSAGRAMLVDIEGERMWVHMGGFSREQYFVILMVMFLEHDTETVSAIDLARIMDGRIQAHLGDDQG